MKRRGDSFGATSWISVLALLAWAMMAAPVHAQHTTIRVGYFPNVTHVHALVAQNLERHGRDWFAERLGPDITVEWQLFNAGPSAMQAILANALDLTYAGPNAAINSYAQTLGEEIRIVSGAVIGGSALVVQPRANLNKPSDFIGKRIVVPESENTQDVSARAWLAAQGIRVSEPGGGGVELVPTPNSKQLALFELMQVDAAWTVEPWVARLELLADGKILIEEKNSITTVLVSSSKFLKTHPDLTHRFVAAHRELTDWIGKNPAATQRMITEELQIRFKTRITNQVLAHAWERILVTNEISLAKLQEFVERAKVAGYFRSTPELSRLVEMP